MLYFKERVLGICRGQITDERRQLTGTNRCGMQPNGIDSGKKMHSPNIIITTLIIQDLRRKKQQLYVFLKQQMKERAWDSNSSDKLLHLERLFLSLCFRLPTFEAH